MAKIYQTIILTIRKYLQRLLASTKLQKIEQKHLFQLSESMREIGVGIIVAVMILFVLGQKPTAEIVLRGAIFTGCLWYTSFVLISVQKND